MRIPLDYNRRFRRLWELYLAWSEAGFLEGRLGDVQVLLAKPGYRQAAGRDLRATALA